MGFLSKIKHYAKKIIGKYTESVEEVVDQVEEVERLVKKLRSNITPTEEPDEESSGKESNGVKDTAVKVVVNN